MILGIVDGGAAAKDGRLRVGDRILEANGTSFGNATHLTVVQVNDITHSSVTLGRFHYYASAVLS